ncbi:protein ANKUB1-like [Styela clava]
MRVFVTFGGTRITVDIQPEDDVKLVKSIVEDKLLLETHEDKKEGKVLDLIYGGASLQDDWILQDVGINSGTTIKCQLKMMQKPKLYVLLGYTDEVLEIMNDINPITTTFATIKSIISETLGLPVSAYRLCVFNPSLSHGNPKKKEIEKDDFIEIFDCNTMENYGLEIGSTVKLEVWDGWSEFIKVALQGHEKRIDQFLSYGEDERHFQRRIALQIAAHFNYTGLAYAMLRSGARPDIPVGVHPTREWCGTGDHIETKKCAIHEASERGNLNVMRMLIKSNLLCFVSKDGKGRTPWEIVIEKFHKDCFEYLLARQWGRKSGNDVSLPILIYCKVLQWCERARNRVLVMHGAAKSTLRGRPSKVGALIGNGVAVDGLNNKRMSSVPLSAMPKPTVSPRRMLPALAKAKRRFRRQKSSMVFTKNFTRKGGDSRGQIYSRNTSSQFSIPRSPSSTIMTENMSSNNASLVFPPEDNPTRSHTGKSNKVEYIENIDNQQKPIDELGNAYSSKEKTTLPPISTSKEQVNERHYVKKRQNRYTVWDNMSVQSSREKNMPGNQRRTVPKQVAVDGGKVNGIPLPFNSFPGFRKPFMYWGTAAGDENPIEVTLSRFETYRGTSARDNAIHCLTLADTFSKKPWLSRANMASRLARRGVLRNTAAFAE